MDLFAYPYLIIAEVREITIRFTLSYHQLPPRRTCLVFFPRSIREWNSLPISLIELNSLATFSNMITDNL